MKKFNLNAVALSAGLLAAILMLLIGVLASFGVYMEAFKVMQAFHLYFDLTVVGIILGMVEAFVITVVSVYLFAGIYSLITKK